MTYYICHSANKILQKTNFGPHGTHGSSAKILLQMIKLKDRLEWNMGGARGIGIKKFPNNKIQLETY